MIEKVLCSLSHMTYDSNNRVLALLHLIVRPLIKLMLESGIGFREFSQVCKTEFVRVCSKSYGLRGRPTNVSRIAVMTGLTRKEVRQIKDHLAYGDEMNLAPQQLNVPSLVLHHWHSDPDFLDKDRKPKAIKASGEGETFAELCRRYAGDIPHGAVRVELARSGAIVESESGMLLPTTRYYTPKNFGDEFVHSMVFSIANLVNSLVRNAQYSQDSDKERLMQEGLFERYVWSTSLNKHDAEIFKQIAEEKGTALLAELDEWIGTRERRAAPDHHSRVPLEEDQGLVGLGMYLFSSDKNEK